MALEPAASESYRLTIQRDIEYWQGEMKLTPQELAAARAMASTLPHPTAPPDGFDWSHGMNPDGNAGDCERP